MSVLLNLTADPDRVRLYSSNRADQPAQLDREADRWLSVGRIDQAERLAHRAAELRQTGADRQPALLPREVRA